MKTKHLALIFALAAPFAGAEIFTLNPTQDSDVYQGSGFPTGSVGTLGVTPSGGSGHSQWSLIEFSFSGGELAGISGDDVMSAMLQLRIEPGTDFAPHSAGPMTIVEQDSAWSADTLTWDGFDPDAPIGTFMVGDETSTESMDVFAEFDVTSYVQGALADPAGDHGILLQPASEFGGAAVSFASMETDAPPELMISTVPEPETYALILGGLVLAFTVIRKRR